MPITENRSLLSCLLPGPGITPDENVWPFNRLAANKPAVAPIDDWRNLLRVYLMILYIMIVIVFSTNIQKVFLKSSGKQNLARANV
jgi:hypothetical protein